VIVRCRCDEGSEEMGVVRLGMERGEEARVTCEIVVFQSVHEGKDNQKLIKGEF
jgi:hypothetical protein